MNEANAPAFDAQNIHEWIEAQDPESLDGAEFGVIGFDDEGVVRRYNAVESRLAGLSATRVLGQALFTVVAPCMNNFLVAQRFEDATATGTSLDAMVDYVLTLKMRPEKVRLRLLAAPEIAHRYVLVERQRR